MGRGEIDANRVPNRCGIGPSPRAAREGAYVRAPIRAGNRVPPRRKATRARRATQSSFPDGADHTLFTIGYSGHTPGSFADSLLRAKVAQLIDVRSVPRSRKPGFSGKGLRAFVEARGIAYVHLPRLGAPPALLERKKGGAAFADIAGPYSRHLAGQRAALGEVAGLAQQLPSALMCLEEDPRECHRGILAKRLAREGFKVEHL